ncbi:tRNA (adenosine(37)-N6)-threonylcarbamoyltransferase complex dimerization subunit type 1 TsaB [SAR202 cluster bacterium AD-804-J14_MRT_500m]|nr:tRNA (adenosine(37)-N6)-threonylcarbamoyltransferase complex dimerization subunit type 1 TsaB [SAR202 cluster bacterium AD-804-J14_MRT_500m]
MLLAIDTSSRYAGVSLCDDGTPLISQSWHSSRNHTKELTPAIQHILKTTAINLSDLEGICVALGPGGFSALRVGLSVAKGFALALKLPLFGITTLEAEAFHYRSLGRPVCSLLSVGRGEVAYSIFNIDECIRQPEIKAPDEIPVLAPENTVFCGEGLNECQNRLELNLGEHQLIAEYSGTTTRLNALATIGEGRRKIDDPDNAATLQPLYLRSPSISTPNPPRKIKL